jgi:nucleoside-diphosphate-sugar epimerase
MKILIIGYKGFIGKYLFNYLKLLELEVYGVSSAEENGIDPKTGMLSDTFSISPGTDAVVYLAQSPHYRQVPDQASHLLNVNVVSAVKVADMARKAKVKRFIYTSTGNVYQPSFQPLTETSPLNRNNWYSLSKIHAEEALALFSNDMDITIARLFGVYGPSQTDKLIPNLIEKVQNEKNIFLARNPHDLDDLDGLKISLLYIDDLLKILTSILLQHHTVNCINIAGKEVLSLRKIVNIIGNFLHKSVNLEVIEEYRKFDLIADIKLLNKINNNFTPFSLGIEKTIAELLNTVNH